MKFTHNKHLPFYLLSVLFLTLILCLNGCASATETETISPQDELPLQQEINASGEIVPVKWTSLSFPNGGTNLKFNVKEGETVEEKNVLATNSDPRLLSQLSQAMAAQIRAEVNYNQVLNSPSEASLASLEAALANAEVRLEQTEWNLPSQKQLVAAQADVESASLNLEELKKGSSEEEIAAALADLKAAQHSVEAMNQSLEITAPYNGTVVEILANPGESVPAYQPVITFADLSEFQVVTTDLSEVDVSKLFVGQSVDIVIDAFPNQSSTGKISQIDSKSSGGSAVYYTVTFDFDNPPAGLLWGMTTFITFLND